MPKYTASSYDDYLCLKPPLMLWITVVYLSRAVTGPVVMGLGSAARMSPDATRLLTGFWSTDTLLPSLIAVAVLVAMCRRVPQASRVVRWVWSHGRWLLAASAGIDLALLAISLVRNPPMPTDGQVPPLSLLMASLDAYFLLYILTVRRVRDTFASFPLLSAPR